MTISNSFYVISQGVKTFNFQLFDWEHINLRRQGVNQCFHIFFQPSSCLTDRDGGDQIYDYASKYRQQIRNQQAKMLMTPQG